jgi:hypothetical protein
MIAPADEWIFWQNKQRSRSGIYKRRACKKQARQGKYNGRSAETYRFMEAEFYRKGINDVQ